MDVLILRCDWNERTGSSDAGDFLEVWEDSPWSADAIAREIEESECGANGMDELEEWAEEEGLTLPEMREVLINWVNRLMGWLPQVGTLEDKEPGFLSYWTLERCGLSSGKPDNWQELEASAAHGVAA